MPLMKPPLRVVVEDERALLVDENDDEIAEVLFIGSEKDNEDDVDNLENIARIVNLHFGVDVK